MPETKTASFEVFADNLPRLREKLEELNRRIARLGKKGYPLPPLALSEGASRVVKLRRGDSEFGPVVEYVMVEVALTGPSVKAAGWEFVASLQHEEAGTIIRAVPGNEGLDLSAYREALPLCEHCAKAIRRKDTFLLRNEAGAFKQVGRNCLAEFLGIDPFAYARAAEFLAAFRGAADDWDEEFRLGGSPRAWDLSTLLTFVACEIRSNGWVSRTKARETDRTASVDMAISHGVCSPPNDQYALRPSPEDAALAVAALTWAGPWLERDEALSDYEHNLRVALLAGYATARTAGIIGSLVAVYQREQEKARLATVHAASQHVGEVGKRQVFAALRVVSIREFEGFYGVTALHRFVDPAGNILTWFASGSGSPFEVDGSYDLVATVKKHEEYKGVRQTQLVRCALAPAPKAPKAPAASGGMSPAQRAAATRKARLAAAAEKKAA